MMELDRTFIKDTFDEAVRRIPMLHKYTGEEGIGTPSLYFPESREWTPFSLELLLHPAFSGSFFLIKNKKGEFGVMVGCIMAAEPESFLVFVGRFEIDDQSWDDPELIDLEDLAFIAPMTSPDGDLFDFEPLDEDLFNLEQLIDPETGGEWDEEGDYWEIELNLN